MIRKIDELDLRNKITFLRVDFNVPIKSGKVTEGHRIESTIPTIERVLRQAKKIVIASHLGRPDRKTAPQYSLAPVREYLQNCIKQPVALAPDCIGPEVEQLVRQSSDRI